MRKLIFLIIFVALGCETLPKPRAASEYLFSTNKSTNLLFDDVKTNFDQHKYKTDRRDDSAGILLLAPRLFSFMSAGRKTYAHQYVQMRQEGGSLKLRLAYDCNYSGDQKTFVPCLEDDRDLADKIDRLELAFVDVLKPVLVRTERATASSHLIDDKPVDPK